MLGFKKYSNARRVLVGTEFVQRLSKGSSAFPPISVATSAQFGGPLSPHELHLCLTATEPIAGWHT
jgi:hypothetical protein